jgi:uncharacterized protein YjbI with pentapeptide repeats
MNDTNNADLAGATFTNTNLAGAEFKDVDLAGAQFTDVTFSGASFEDVSLIGAVFHNVNCTDLSIESATYDGMRLDGIPVTELLRVYREQHPDKV